MNAFAAAEGNGKATELQDELGAFSCARTLSNVNRGTSIPATFLRVTAPV